jgi:hypothetical protein
MSISSLGSPPSTSSGLSEMVKRTMSEVDTNKDGQLSATEFGTFLTHLLEGLSQKTRLTNASSAAVSSVSTAAGVTSKGAGVWSAADGPYFNVPGFDLSKLQNTSHVNDKYTPAVRCFSQCVAAQGLASVSGSLPSIVTYAQNNGFPDAKVVSSDAIDFGDGHGVIDTIVDVGGPNAHWWFHNNLKNT